MNGDISLEYVISHIIVLDLDSDMPFTLATLFFCVTMGGFLLWNAITENRLPSSVTSKQMALPMLFGMLVALSFIFTLPAFVVLSLLLSWIMYKVYNNDEVPLQYENNQKGIVTGWTFRMEKQRKENHGKLPKGMTLPPIEELYIPFPKFLAVAILTDVIRVLVRVICQF